MEADWGPHWLSVCTWLCFIQPASEKVTESLFRSLSKLRKQWRIPLTFCMYPTHLRSLEPRGQGMTSPSLLSALCVEDLLAVPAQEQWNLEHNWLVHTHHFNGCELARGPLMSTHVFWLFTYLMIWP